MVLKKILISIGVSMMILSLMPAHIAAFAVSNSVTRSDTVSITASASVKVDRHVTRSDTVSITASASVKVDRHVTRSDTVSISDSASVRIGRSVTPSDTISISESASAARGRSVSRSDTVTISDSATSKIDRMVAVIDTVDINDSSASSTARYVSPSDTVDINDSSASSTARYVSPSDTVDINDSSASSTTSRSTITPSDTLKIDESATASKVHSISSSDSLSISDTASASEALSMILSDTVSITDSASVSDFQRHNIAPSDTVSLTDSAKASATVSAGDGFTAITINSVKNTTPRWGLDAVAVSGNTTHPAGAFNVIVDWGDGTIATMTGSSSFSGTVSAPWGPFSHKYSSAHTGTNLIVARLLDNNNQVMATSAPYAVNVQKHNTKLSLLIPSAIPRYGTYAVTGVLKDSDSGAILSSMRISFTADPPINISPKVTNSIGQYFATGLKAPGTAGLYHIQSYFAGDALYAASNSPVQTLKVTKR